MKIVPKLYSNQEIIDRFRSIVFEYAWEHIDVTDDVKFTINDVYVVWQVKVLKNWKALLSTNLPDGMYYECTYNGDKNEIYFDAYKKFENCVFPLDTSSNDTETKDAKSKTE